MYNMYAQKRLKLEEEDAHLQNQSTIACKALNIVLQHFMVPELGWSLKSSLQDDLIRLRREIIENKLSRMNSNNAKEKKIVQDLWENTLSNAPIDASYELFVPEIHSFERAIEQLEILPASYSLPIDDDDEDEHEEIPEGVYFEEETVISHMNGWFENYFCPILLMFEYRTVVFAHELHRELTECYRSFTEYLKKQQEMHPGVTSLVVYQLVVGSQWKQSMDCVATTVFSFGTIPALLQDCRSKGIPASFLPRQIPKNQFNDYNDYLYIHDELLPFMIDVKNHMIRSIEPLTRFFTSLVDPFHEASDLIRLMISRIHRICQSWDESKNCNDGTQQAVVLSVSSAKNHFLRMMKQINKTTNGAHLCDLKNSMVKRLHGRKYIRVNSGTYRNFNPSASVQRKLSRLKGLQAQFQDLSILSELNNQREGSNPISASLERASAEENERITELNWELLNHDWYKYLSQLYHLKYNHELLAAMIRETPEGRLVAVNEFPVNVMEMIDEMISFAFEGLALAKYLFKCAVSKNNSASSVYPFIDLVIFAHRRKLLDSLLFAVVSGKRYFNYLLSSHFLWKIYGASYVDTDSDSDSDGEEQEGTDISEEERQRNKTFRKTRFQECYTIARDALIATKKYVDQRVVEYEQMMLNEVNAGAISEEEERIVRMMFSLSRNIHEQPINLYHNLLHKSFSLKFFHCPFYAVSTSNDGDDLQSLLLWMEMALNTMRNKFAHREIVFPTYYKDTWGQQRFHLSKKAVSVLEQCIDYTENLDADNIREYVFINMIVAEYFFHLSNVAFDSDVTINVGKDDVNNERTYHYRISKEGYYVQVPHKERIKVMDNLLDAWKQLFPTMAGTGKDTWDPSHSINGIELKKQIVKMLIFKEYDEITYLMKYYSYHVCVPSFLQLSSPDSKIASTLDPRDASLFSSMKKLMKEMNQFVALLDDNEMSKQYEVGSNCYLLYCISCWIQKLLVIIRMTVEAEIMFRQTRIGEFVYGADYDSTRSTIMKNYDMIHNEIIQQLHVYHDAGVIDFLQTCFDESKQLSEENSIPVLENFLKCERNRAQVMTNARPLFETCSKELSKMEENFINVAVVFHQDIMMHEPYYLDVDHIFKPPIDLSIALLNETNETHPKIMTKRIGSFR